MSCNTLTGATKDCTPNIKGIKNIYIADLLDVSSYTVVAGVVTAITMVATSPVGLFYKYEFRKTSGSNYTEDQVDPTVGLDGWAQIVTLILNKRDVDKRNEIAILAEGFRDLIIIAEDNNGTFWFLGANNGLNLTATTGGSESANYTMTFSGEEKYQAYTFTEGLLAAII